MRIETPRYSLIQGDCLEEMKKLPDQSIDLILCDPPYGTTSCLWDEVIPFDLLWDQYRRLIKPHGAIVLFGSQPFTSKLILSNIDWFREEIVWLKNKAGSGLQAKQKHIKTHENIVVFSPKGTYTFNPQKWLVDKKEFLTQRKTFKEVEIGNNVYSKITRTQTGDDGTRNPISIVSCRVPFTPSKSKTYSKAVDLRYHPTQKPLDLMDYLVKTFSNEGDTVLDHCMGSGTTGVSAVRLGRYFIGMELLADYFNIAHQRISEVE